MRLRYILWMFFFLLTAVVFFSDADLLIATYFFDPDSQQFPNHPFFRFWFEYGTYPALFIAIASAIVFILGFIHEKAKKVRKEALFLSLTLALGSGLAINGLIKPLWGRPRPKNVEAFGGAEAYRPWHVPGGQGKSFCSGHSSMGFYFYVLYRLGKRKNWLWMKRPGLAMLPVMAGGLSLARVAVGGHFLTDVLAGGWVMIGSTRLLEMLLFRRERRNECLDEVQQSAVYSHFETKDELRQ